MKIKLVLTLLILTIANCSFGQLKTETIVLKTKTGNLYGSLISPPSSSKTPIALIIAGSGPTDRNGNNPMMTNNSLKMLAEGLAEKGIASLRYDKRGIGESKSANIDESKLRFEDYINDVKDWIALLKKDTRFNNLIVLGHSEGSLLGMIASQNEQVNKFVSIAGTGVPAAEIIREQLKAQPPNILMQSLPIIEKLEQGKTVDNVPAMLNSLFRPSIQPYMISWFKYHPKKEISKLTCPVLIVQGTTDIQVGVNDAEKLAQANKNSKKVIVDGMNHVLKEAELDRIKNLQTYNDPNLPLKQELVLELVKFIKD